MQPDKVLHRSLTWATGMAAMLALAIIGNSLPASAQPKTLDGYIAIAVANNPRLRSYSLRAEAAEKRIKPASSLTDPMLMLGVTNVPSDLTFNTDMMTMKEIGISQMLMVPGKYSLMGTMAEKDHAIALDDYDTKKLELIASVKMEYYNLYSMDRSISVMKRSIDLLKDFVKIASTRFETGQGIQQDVLKAQVELTMMNDELIRMQADRNNMAARFNTLLARAPSDSVEIPDELTRATFGGTLDSLQGEAFRRNPMILSMQRMVEKDEAMHQLARRAVIPDFDVKLSYGRRETIDIPTGMKASDMVSASVEMNLPVFFWRKQNLKAEEAEITVSQSESQLRAVRNEVTQALQESLNEIDKDSKLIDLYRSGLIPQATQNLNAGLAGYQVGKIDFMTLVDNFLLLNKYQIEYEKVFAEYHKKLADLEMLTAAKILP